MRRIVVRLQEKPARNIPIAIIDKPAIRPDKRFAVFAIDRRKAIPGDARPAVMENVQIVVEKQQAEEIAVFDDGGAFLMAAISRVRNAGKAIIVFNLQIVRQERPAALPPAQ